MIRLKVPEIGPMTVYFVEWDKKVGTKEPLYSFFLVLSLKQQSGQGKEIFFFDQPKNTKKKVWFLARSSSSSSYMVCYSVGKGVLSDNKERKWKNVTNFPGSDFAFVFS